MGGGARRAGWSVLAQRCCLVLCTAAIASIGAAALSEPATPTAKHATAPRQTTKLNTHRSVAHVRHSIRHGGSGAPASSEDRPVASLSDRINADTVAVIAGGLGSTELAVAQDLAATLDDGDNLRILPVVGAGGVRNIRDMRFVKGVDLAITQTSLLARASDSSEIGKIDDKIVYLTKLFNEEMHVLVRADSELVSLDQLGGRTVSLGETGSGTQLIARDVLARLGIAVREANMVAPEAIDRLKAGEIDAAVLIGGKPVPALAQIPAGLRLLPVPFAKPVREDFLPTALSSDDYPGLIEPGHRIDTLAVGTVLIANNWPKDGERYRKIEKFVTAFFARLAALQAPPRHPKWREVNLAASLPGWTRFAAAQEWIAQQQREVAGGPGDAAPFVSARTAQGSVQGSAQGNAQGAAPAGRASLFDEFRQWDGAHARQ